MALTALAPRGGANSQQSFFGSPVSAGRPERGTDSPGESIMRYHRRYNIPALPPLGSSRYVTL